MITSVLVADDSASQRALLEASLKAAGVKEVTLTSNGKEAFELLSAQPYRFQLLVTDLKMPVMDGIQLIESLSDTEYPGGVAIYSQLEERIVKFAIDLAREHRVHLVGNLKKPYEESDLTSIIERADHLYHTATNTQKFAKQKVILAAVEKGNIVPYFQPQVDADTMALRGLEILCRVKIPNEMEFLLPEVFMPVVDKHGLVDLLTYKTLEAALKEFKSIEDDIENSSKLTISLNVLPQQLTNEKFPDMLITICELADFPVERVVIEITEGQALDSTRKITTLERLRIAGFGVALDDFGTGFTNMGQIRNYPFTEIKMDRTMIHNIHRDRVSQVILGTMLELRKSYPLSVVAEGVEDEADFNYLSQFSGVVLQGNLVCRPKPISNVSRWLKVWSKQFCDTSLAKGQG